MAYLPKRVLCMALASAGLAMFSSSATAATTVGQAYVPPSAGGCLALSLTSTAVGDNLYVVPLDGVITSWSHGASYANASLKFKVYRPTVAASVFRVVGESGYEPLTQGVVNTLPVRIPVKAGDLLGMRPLANFNVDCSDNDVNGRATRGCSTNPCADAPPGTDDTLSAVGASQHLNIRAQLEADADADGFGDETQDKCLLIKGSADGCIAADLAAPGVADFTQQQVGEQVAVAINVDNNGPDPVPNATVTQTFPAGMQLRAGSVQNPRGPCSVGGSSITCPVGTLAPGELLVLGVGYTVTAPGSHALTTTIASPDLDAAKAAAASAGDTNPANNTHTLTIDGTAAPSPPPTGPNPPVLPPPPVVDRAAPAIDIFRLSRKVFTTGRARRGVKKGTGFVWLVTETGTLEITIEKRNSRGRFTKSGTLSYPAAKLRETRSWSGKIGRKRLGVGSYRATIRATDAAGNRSRARKATFRIVK